MDSPLKWIEIFKAGRHTSGNGITRDYPASDLDQVVETYNPDQFKAPLIVTYPAHNTAGYSDDALHASQLAYGYPKTLKRIGDRLMAGFEKLSPKIKEWFGNGELLGFSSSFYLPNSPANPYPGKLALRHIAGCGVNPPAVKGMEAPEFAQPIANFASYEPDQAGAVEFSLIDDSADAQTLQDAQVGARLYRAIRAIDLTLPTFSSAGMAVQSLAGAMAEVYQRLRDREIAAVGAEAGDRMFPAWLLQQFQLLAVQQDATGPDVLWGDIQLLHDRINELHDKDKTTHYQEGGSSSVTTTPEFTQIQAENERLSAQVQQIQAEREQERVTNFIENLVRDRKLFPSDASDEVSFILSLPNVATVDYGEAGSLTQRQRYMDKLAARRPLWSDKRPPVDPQDAPDGEDISFAEDFSGDYSPESIKADRQIRACMKQHNLSYSAAIDHLKLVL